MSVTSPPAAAVDVDVDALPPTQYLIVEVLAARWRTGEQVWTFPARLRSALTPLADAGLVGWKAGIEQGTVLAWLTDAGRAAALDGRYELPGAHPASLRRQWTVRQPGPYAVGVGGSTFDEAKARNVLADWKADRAGDRTAARGPDPELVSRWVSDWETVEVDS